MKKYERISDDILHQILSGTLKDGDRLMTEDELVRMYGVSRMTVRTAMDRLKEQGLIRRIAGSGTFVTHPLGAHPEKRNYIATILPDAAKEMTDLIDALESTLAAENYRNLVYLSRRNPQTEREQCETAIREGAKGLVVFPADEESNAAFYTALIEREFPIVFLDRAPKGLPCDLIACNGFLGMVDLTQYLIRNGHTELALVCCPFLRTVEERVFGFRHALEKNGLPLRTENLIFLKKPFQNLEDDRSEIGAALDAMLAGPHPPTAVVCVNDVLAIAVIDLLSERSVRVPEDLSVTGYDNTEYGKTKFYSLTTVEQDFRQMGALAGERVLKKCADPHRALNATFLRPKLNPRNSVRNLYL